MTKVLNRRYLITDIQKHNILKLLSTIILLFLRSLNIYTHEYNVYCTRFKIF